MTTVTLKGYLIVEGHGEVRAAHNLISRLGAEICPQYPWSAPRRWLNLHLWESPRRGGVKRAAELMRSRTDVGALLILKDEDDGCPRDIAPKLAERLRRLRLPFPTAYVLFHPEYEVLFLPCLASMGFPPWDRDSWEARRGVKEWLSAHHPGRRSYKPTIDQEWMTRCIDFSILRKANVPCFGSLERALGFLCRHWGQPGVVYPQPMDGAHE